jgi:hypothetical protein
MGTPPQHDHSLVFSYLAHRKTIGILGTVLPMVLFLGAVLLFGTGLQSSVSSYYHTSMGNVFVGFLFVIGFFLLSYYGYDQADRRAGNFGFLSAIGVALFPTTPAGPVSDAAQIIGYLHLAFAALFFATLIYFSLFLFTKTSPSRPPSARKLQRNRVYRWCGYIMIVCIAAIAVYSIVPDTATAGIARLQPVFWLEAIAVMAFGVSWLTKGEAILKDVS